MKISPLAVLPLILAGCATVPSVQAVPSLAPEVPLMQAAVERLSSDEFEGRAPSGPAEEKVLDYIVGEFRKAGLQPGNNGQWLQEVPMVEITATNPSALTISGKGPARSYTWSDDWAAGSFRVVPQTRIADSPLVFVGHGVVAPEAGWNDYAGVDMRGKTAVILSNDPDWFAAAEDASPFKGKRTTYYGRASYKFEEAARQGATAALLVHDPAAAVSSWTASRGGFTGARRYVASADDGARETQANGVIREDVIAEIAKAAGQDFASLVAAARVKGFRAVPLGVNASFGFDSTVRRTRTHNVIGLLPGTSRKDEYVVYGAHWDHLGRCPADARGDAICNGAVDNATGVAALIGMATASRRLGPVPRSQVFAAWTLEESGLLGSKWYAEHPVFPLAQTAANVNIDAIEPGGRTRDAMMRGGDKSDLTAIYHRVLARMGLVATPEARPEEARYYRSDHFSFAKEGVPAFRVVRGDDMIDGGRAAGEAATKDYNANRYHQPSDEFSSAWNWDGIVQDVTMLFMLGREVATMKGWPNWYADDEFRAVRDASCKAARAGCGAAR